MDRLGVFGQWFGSRGRHTRRRGRGGRAGGSRPTAGCDDPIAVMLSCLSAQARRAGREDVATSTAPEAMPEVPSAGGTPPAIAIVPDPRPTDPAWSAPAPVFVPHDWADAPEAAAPVALSVHGHEVTFTVSGPELASPP